jgi:hypothetical protein
MKPRGHKLLDLAEEIFNICKWPQARAPHNGNGWDYTGRTLFTS